MEDKDLLNMYFDMKFHYNEYIKRKNALELLNVNIEDFHLNEKEQFLVENFYVNKRKLKDISEESGLSYGYVRHKMGTIRRKMLKEMLEKE